MRYFLYPLAAALLLTGCATKGTIQSRKLERQTVYAALSPENQKLIDSGQIKVGMPADAVFIAWGAPDQITENEDASGHTTIWIYMGEWMEEARYWNYREVSRERGRALERFIDRDYLPRSYISAELLFRNGQLVSWRTLPRPAN